MQQKEWYCVRQQGSLSLLPEPVYSRKDLQDGEVRVGARCLQHAPARVMLFIRRDTDRQRERMQTSEHPFGTIKHYDGAGHFLCRGKKKVAAETALMYLSYNIRRAIKLAGGVQRLIALFQSRLRPGILMSI